MVNLCSGCLYGHGELIFDIYLFVIRNLVETEVASLLSNWLKIRLNGNCKLKLIINHFLK